METAFKELGEWAAASSNLPEFVAQQKSAQENRPKDHWKDPGTTATRINFAFAMYLARRITLQEYIFMVASSVEGVHDGRISAKAYPELEQLSLSMRQVEQRHGLAADQYWPIKEAPIEYRLLNEKWDAAANKRFLETLIELEGNIAADLYQRSKNEFERLRERGRRSFFHKDELLDTLVDTVKRYEIEARSAAHAGAFTAAIALLGAATEGLLLLRCLRSKAKAVQTAQNLPVKMRPKDVNALPRWTFDQLIHVCLHSGWLPQIETATMGIKPDGLAHQLRQMRNYIHPGKVCTDRPWIQAELREFEDAEAIYTTIYSSVFKGSMLRRFAQSASSPHVV
jgi:hypothetical protein